MSFRGLVFSAFLGALWGMCFLNADYFGLAQPWGYLVMGAGAFVLGIVAPDYRRSGA